MIAIAVVFFFGVATTVYLSLRSPEVTVPNVVGKDRFEAEKILEEANLKYRVRASRPSNQANPDIVLFQLPRAGEVVKTGQTVAMDISRVARAGESAEPIPTPEEPSESRNTNASANANENKPRKPKPKNANDNTNANANTNTNTNANRSANSNRPANVNRANANTTTGNVNAVPRSGNVNQRNTNSPATNSNVNSNRRPVLRPTPAVPKPDR